MGAIPNSLAYLLLSWGVIPALLVILIVYRATLSTREDDQLYLNKVEDEMMASEQRTIINKMNRLGAAYLHPRNPVRRLAAVEWGRLALEWAEEFLRRAPYFSHQRAVRSVPGPAGAMLLDGEAGTTAAGAAGALEETAEVWFITIIQLPARFCSTRVVCLNASMGWPSTCPTNSHW